MRPNKLSLTAFGPYHQTETIDFDALAPHDLFVVSGNTGAGKTSIFDGLSFALFGGASGEDRKEALSLRSDFATDDLPSVVELFFTINDRQYRVMRQLAYQKTGNKSITPAKAELYEIIDKAGEISEIPAVDRQMISNVDAKMHELIGLSKEQFNQLVMLPQGEYQRFLTSATSEKEAILRTVFNTEKYRALTDTLKASRDKAQKETDILAGNLQSILEGIFNTLPKRDSLLFTYINDAGEISLNHHQALEGLQIEAEFYEAEKNRLSTAGHAAYTAHQTAQKMLTSGKVVNENFIQLQMLTEQYRLHLARIGEIEALKHEITLAEKAQPLEKYHEATIRLQHTTQQQQQKRANAQTALTAKTEQLKSAEAILQQEIAKEPQREALTRDIMQLEANAPKVLLLAEKKQLITQLESSLHMHQASFLHAQSALETLTAQYQQLKTSITALSAESEQRIPLMTLSGEILEIEKSIQRIQQEKASFATQSTEKNDALAILTQCKTAFEKHYHTWLSAQASKLASTIQSGEPCPVCGSCEHPKLAHDSDVAESNSPQLAISFESIETITSEISPQEFEEIESTLTEAQSAVVQAEANFAHIESLIQSAQENLKQEHQLLSHHLNDLSLFYASEDAHTLSHLNLPNLSDQFLAELRGHIAFTQSTFPPVTMEKILSSEITIFKNAVTTAEQRSITAGKTLSTARLQLETHEKSLTEQQEALQQLKETIQKNSTKLTIEQQSLAHLTAEIPESLQNAVQFQKSLDEKRTLYQTLKSAFIQAEEHFKTIEKSVITATNTVSHETQLLETFKTELEEARNIFDAALIKAGFIQKMGSENTIGAIQSSETDFIQAQRTPEILRSMREAFQQYQKQSEIFKAQINQLETSLEGKTSVDIEKLEKEAQSAEITYEAARRAQFEVEKQIEAIVKSRTAIESIQSRYQESAMQLRRLIELHDLVRGENSQKISFERYILIEYFERVIEAANLRLHKMTNGQFEFVRSDELASRGKQSGLDLNIYDAYTGEARDVKSLSGGEKFKASLSLSLGMADVIQAHQGGISINTLFIDEGFGSLDEESLLQAIDVLIDLQKSGRMIGVISHVEELKQTLPARIEVTKTRGGFSKTEIIVA